MYTDFLSLSDLFLSIGVNETAQTMCNPPMRAPPETFEMVWQLERLLLDKNYFKKEENVFTKISSFTSTEYNIFKPSSY